MFVITANRLDSGLVVYRTPRSGWSRDIDAAKRFASETEIAPALEAALADVAARIVLDPYGVPIVERSGRVDPAQLRERIRAGGPTVAFAVPAAALDGRSSSSRAA